MNKRTIFFCFLLSLILLVSKQPIKGENITQNSIRSDVIPSDADKVDFVEQTELIKTMCHYIDSNLWSKWAKLYTPVERSDRLDLISNENNIKANIGILTILSFDLLEIIPVPHSSAPWAYTELRSFFEDEHNYSCFRILVDITVREDNGYYRDGQMYQLVVLVRDEGGWGIGVMSDCPSELLPGNEVVHSNPYYEIKAKKYDNASAVFPSYDSLRFTEAGLTASNYFILNFVLPKTWTYREKSAVSSNYLLGWDQSTPFGEDILHIYNNFDFCVGAIGYSLIADPTSFSIYSISTEKFRIRSDNSIIRVTNQLDNPAGNETYIVDLFYYDDYFIDDSGYRSYPTHPAIISYDFDIGVFVIIELNPEYVSGLRLIDIAESIRMLPEFQ